MNRTHHTSAQSVARLGAPAQSILRGSGISNQGLRLRILQDQPRGKDGPIDGPFIVLDAGKNRHTQVLLTLLNRESDSQEVLQLIRQDHPACVNAVNANILVQDESQIAPNEMVDHAIGVPSEAQV
jgi:hypothetical protein